MLFACHVYRPWAAAATMLCSVVAPTRLPACAHQPPLTSPPPRGGVLFQRLVRCGRKSTLCCAFSAARNCFATAGQVLELIPILVALNDKPALRSIAEAVEVQATVRWGAAANYLLVLCFHVRRGAARHMLCHTSMLPFLYMYICIRVFAIQFSQGCLCFLVHQ